MASLGGFVLPLSLSLEVLALMNPSDQRFKIIATTASVYSLASFLVSPPPGSFMTVWPLGMNIYGLAQRCISYLWLKDPVELRRKGENGAAVKEDGKAPVVVKHGVLDAMDIATTFRGVGWAFEARGLPAPPPDSTSRLQFAFSQLFGAVWRFLVLDLGITYVNTSMSTLDGISIPTRLALGFLMMLYVRWTMDIPCRVLSAATVLLGIYKPSDWPPMFGEWSEAYTIRRFWSHTWHQGMRLIAEPPVNFVVTHVFGVPKGSYLNRWSKIVGNFIMAFVDHAYGRILAGGDPMNDWVMFIAQPAAIWVEESVRKLAVSFDLVDEHRRGELEIALGYLWTALFECWTFLDFMEGAIRFHGNVPPPALGLIEPAFGLSAWTPLVQLLSSSA